jgi:hypothetical protein
MPVFGELSEWQRTLRHEYADVRFENVDTQPAGINAVCEGVLVGRFYSTAAPPYGVIFDQPRSCGGR